MDDWDEMKENIQYDYIFDNHFTELKDNELLTERLNSVGMIEPYLGRYFSVDYVRKQVLHFTDEEIEEMDLQIEKEKELGIIQDPMEMDPSLMGMGGEEEMTPGDMNGGESDLDSAFSAAIAPADMAKGKI